MNSTYATRTTFDTGNHFLLDQQHSIYYYIIFQLFQVAKITTSNTNNRKLKVLHNEMNQLIKPGIETHRFFISN